MKTYHTVVDPSPCQQLLLPSNQHSTKRLRLRAQLRSDGDEKQGQSAVTKRLRQSAVTDGAEAEAE